MSIVPVLEQHRPHPSTAQLQAVEKMAEALRRETPELELSETFRDLIPETLQDAPTLHLDDLSEIPLLDRFYDVSFVEDRARFRAGDGDFVASCAPPNPVFETYCEEMLGLGRVEWLRPEPRQSPLSVATACWTDRAVRHALVRALRADQLFYLHPHLASFPVWALASLLRRSSRRPVKVIGPHPGLARLANHKLWFTEVVERLFGHDYVPPTAFAWNFATLARLVSRLAERSRMIVIKVPRSAGGAGNVVIDSRRFRGRSVGMIRKDLKELLSDFVWPGKQRLLVGSWETEVVATPSAQLWIPPPADGAPLVEGIYEQSVTGLSGYFVGSHPATRLPDGLIDDVVTRCWLLGQLYQRLGYIGRCSFDLILVGSGLEDARLQFIECNGRWGGTSIPMTLMNRLFGDWRRQPYATRECKAEGLERFSFSDILSHFEDSLYDARSGSGRLIFYNPGGIAVRSGIDILALANTWRHAIETVELEVPSRLEEMVGDGNR